LACDRSVRLIPSRFGAIQIWLLQHCESPGHMGSVEWNRISRPGEWLASLQPRWETQSNEGARVFLTLQIASVRSSNHSLCGPALSRFGEDGLDVWAKGWLHCGALRSPRSSAVHHQGE